MIEKVELNFYNGINERGSRSGHQVSRDWPDSECWIAEKLSTADRKEDMRRTS